MVAAAARNAESLLAFWAEAGVEASYADAAIDRLAEGEARLKAKAPVMPAVPHRPAAPAARGPDIGTVLAEARAAAAAAQDLEALAAAIAAFDGCPLKFEGARQAVFSRGNPKAEVMVIGEGPGAEEDQQGAPFVGRAGKLLDRMLAAIGLDRAHAYIANVIPWRPPGNRTPTPQETQACLPFIRRQIALADPDVLVLLGGTAAQALTGTKDGILRTRGRWQDYDSGQRVVPMMATLHPAYLLRTPLQKRLAWQDFLAIREALDRAEGHSAER